MPRILVTGFPGFLASAFVPRLLDDRPDAHVVALVESRMRAASERRLDALASDDSDVRDRVSLVEGDITRADMGWDDPGRTTEGVTEVFHFAAAYDLALTLDVGERVNVLGTRNVLDLCERLESLERLHYVSTCYVSGRTPGWFRENELEARGPFNNAYEETKHRAEREVRERMAGGLPTTVYRPAAVVGDSTTGATGKFDGPYLVIRFMLRQPKWMVLPTVGDLRTNRVNIAPVDFVVDAMVALSRQPDTVGRTFQLADPDPPTNAWLLEEMARHAGRRVLRIRIPEAVARWALTHVGPMKRWLGLPAGGIGYFTHPTRYDTSGTRTALEDTGIACPAMAEYVEKLVAFSRSVPKGQDPPGAPLPESSPK